MANYREPQWLLPNEKNLQYPAAGATYGSGLSADRHSLYSMDFGGAEYIDYGDSENLSFGDSSTDSPFSISAWIYMDNASNFRIVSKYDAPNYEYQFDVGSSNKLQFYIFDGSNYRGVGYVIVYGPPIVEAAKSITPVLAFILTPVLAVNVPPAVVPAANVGVAVPICWKELDE